MAQIGSWQQPVRGKDFSDRQSRGIRSISHFYSLPGTSFYNTFVDTITPAIRAGLRCLSRDELYNKVGPRIGGGAQFDTFTSQLDIPGTSRGMNIVAIKRIHRDARDKIEDGTQGDDVRRKLRDIMTEFQFLCHKPFRKHENIIKLLAYGWEQDFAAPVLVLEYADLGNLEGYLADTAEVSWSLKRQICLDIAAGLEMLHAAHVVHGDLKPRNILMFKVEKEGKESAQAKLSDFGLSIGDLDMDEAWYRGTSLWIPPEARETHHKIPTQSLSRCDIFSLGLVIWTVVRKAEDFVDETWIPRADDDDLSQQLQHLFPISLLEHSVQRPSFRNTRNYHENAIRFIKGLGQNELLHNAVQYVRSIAATAMEGPPSDVLSCFVDALNATLQDDPEQRKSASEVMALLATSDTPSVRRAEFGEQGYEMIAYDRAASNLSLIWGARLHLRLQFEAQRILRTELENVASTKGDRDCHMLLDLALCYAEGVGGPVNPGKMMDVLKRAALEGSRPAAGLFVRMGGAIDFKENGPKNEFAIINPGLTEQIQFLLPDPELTVDETHFYITKLRADSTAERVRKAPKALETAKERPLLPGDYYFHGVHSLEIGDVCNRWLHYFIHQGDLDAFTNFIQGRKSSHFSYDGRNMDIETPLLVASRYGLDFAAVGLLCLGADPNLAMPGGTTPLHFLSMFEDEQIPILAELFLRRGANLHASSAQYWPSAFAFFKGSPLHWAVQMRCVGAVTALLNHGADINDRSAGNTPLEIATDLFAHDIVEVLLERGALNCGHTSSSGPTSGVPCFHFISAGMDLGSPIMAKQLMHGGALPTAVERTIDAYLKRGVDIDERDRRGNTALLRGCMNPDYNISVLKSLIRHGARLDARNKEGLDAIDCILEGAGASWGSEQTARPKLELILHHHPFRVGDRATDAYRLHKCSSQNLPVLLRELLKAGIDPDARLMDDSHWSPAETTRKFMRDRRLPTPLHSAAESDSPECVRGLLDFHADVNALSGWDGDGLRLTPLALAVIEGHTDAVDELMKEPNVSIWLPTIHGETPSVLNLPHFYQRNTMDMRTNMITHLLWSHKSHFVTPEVLNATLAGFNPLHGATASGDDVAVQRLLEAGADPNTPAMVDEDNPFSRPQDSVKTWVEDEHGGSRWVSVVDEEGLATRLPKAGRISCLDLAITLRRTPKNFLEKEITKSWLCKNFAIIKQLLEAGATLSHDEFKAFISRKADPDIKEILGQTLRQRGGLVTVSLADLQDKDYLEKLNQNHRDKDHMFVWVLQDAGDSGENQDAGGYD